MARAAPTNALITITASMRRLKNDASPMAADVKKPGINFTGKVDGQIAATLLTCEATNVLRLLM
jgi:hypothetical protein